MATRSDVRRIALSLPGAVESTDHFAFSVGTAKLKLQAIATQLDDRRDTSGVVHRYMMQHRLLFTPHRWGIALWEGSVLDRKSVV